MKKAFLFLVIASLAAAKSYGQAPDNCATGVILSGYSERSFTTDPVTDQQLDVVLQCGIKAPSARNIQPWKFTVIRDDSTMKKIINNVVSGNVLIVISGLESESGVTTGFDCGLATESMFVAAHGLGLGARIYGGPIGNVISNRELFQIPEGYKPIMILRIGNVDKSVDAVSSATPRKSPEEVINYVR